MNDDQEPSDRIEVIILGRVLGTAEGWDGEPGECIWFYEFEPKDGISLGKGDLQVDFNSGAIGIQTNAGGIDEPVDIVEFLTGVAKQ